MAVELNFRAESSISMSLIYFSFIQVNAHNLLDRAFSLPSEYHLQCLSSQVPWPQQHMCNSQGYERGRCGVEPLNKGGLR